VPPVPSRSDRSSPSQRAGLVRVAFALAALTFADTVFPGMPNAYLVFGANLVMAIVFQVLIHRGIAPGEQRSLWMGLFDIAFLTFVVYLLGPASSVMAFLYLLIPVLNATSSTSRTRVAMRLAGTGSVAYTALLVVTALGILPHAPARPELAQAVPPVAQLIASGSLVSLSVIVTTSLVLRQMNALDRMNKRLAELSHLDELTGLYNRRYLLSELRRQLDRVARDATCGLMMIDLDRFKRVNDEQGHDAGDLLLMDIAGALSAETRAVDIVARYGGDEFVIVLPDVTPEGLMAVGERVVAAVARVGRERWADTPVTASLGLTMARGEDDITTLLRRADSAAYAAKHAGGNGQVMTPHIVQTRSGLVPAPDGSRGVSQSTSDGGKRRASG
jgi:diguanylate cyclase (GGDEF)-like protein